MIDGNSTDKSLDIIKHHDSTIDKWMSEPDGGIAEAMNKGIDIATGDYILFINSDDYLINNTALQRVSEHLENGIDIFIFKVLYSYPDGRELISLNHAFGNITKYKMGSCHQGQLISRKLLLKPGKLDESFGIYFDYDLILRAYNYGASSRSVDIILSVMRQVGVSSIRDWMGFKTRYDEERLVHFKNCCGILWYLIYKLYWLFYIPYRRTIYELIFLNKKYLKNKTIKFIQ